MNETRSAMQLLKRTKGEHSPSPTGKKLVILWFLLCIL